MPKLRQRKDGGYYIRTSGHSDSINTFQTTDQGASIVKSSGRELGEYFPDQLFFLLYDLGHLSTKGTGSGDPDLSDINNIEWATEELSVEQRIEVALQIIDEHGVSQLFEGDAAKWVLTLMGEDPVFLKPLIEEIAEESGYGYEAIREYNELMSDKNELLEAALCAHIQMQGLRTVDDFHDHEAKWEILGTDGEFAYLGTQSKGTFGIVGEMPDSILPGLQSQLRSLWKYGIGAAGLAALAKIGVQQRHDVSNGIVLPRERLGDFPVELPPRSELTEQYEVLRLLQSHIDHVLASPEASVEHGDGSYCDSWYEQVHERLAEENHGIEPLGTQQRDRLDFTVQTYRDCYGDGEKVTDFACVGVAHPDESEQLRLFGFGIFDHSESVRVPVAPESETTLPVYPQSQGELDHAVELLDEFPLEPEAGPSS